MTKEEAETSCNLKIIVELFDFEVIKEAAMELYCRGRKVREFDNYLIYRYIYFPYLRNCWIQQKNSTRNSMLG
jgi:hypothetical protein